MVEVIHGRWCRPQTAANEDRTLRAAGFAAPMVDVTEHLDQFVPLLVEHFGGVWWQRGSICLAAVTDTASGEPVRCYLEPGPPSRARLWMNGEGEELVLEGSAALGDDPESALRRLFDEHDPRSEVRILADVAPGSSSGIADTRITAAAVDERLGRLAEPMACYRESAPFGARVAPVSLVAQAMAEVLPHMAPLRGPVDAMTGAVELCLEDGPVLADRDYRLQGRVIGVSSGPGSEQLWYQSELYHPAGERLVARLLRMDRLLKSSSPLWSD